MGLFDNNDEQKQLQAEMQRQKHLPPGQSLTLKWPVLHGAHSVLRRGSVEVQCCGFRRALRMELHRVHKLARIEVKADFHCVTHWSRV